MAISEYKIQGQTKRELIIEFFSQSDKLRKFKRNAKRAPNLNIRGMWEVLMDIHGNLAQVALLRVGLFDHILTVEVL